MIKKQNLAFALAAAYFAFALALTSVSGPAHAQEAQPEAAAPAEAVQPQSQPEAQPEAQPQPQPDQSTPGTASERPSDAGAESGAIAPPQTVETIPVAQPELPQAQGESGTQLETVTVTASRHAQGIQDVVGGIQAVTGAELERQGASGFKDYLTQVPGVGFRQDGSGNSKIGMRGVSNVSGNQLGTFSGSSPVGVYLNDIPIQGSGQLPDLDLFDLDRIEVLKGPQGTLYGEGAMGGAIRMLLAEPNLYAKDIKAETSTAMNKRGGLNDTVKVAGGMPVVEGAFGLRGALSYKKTAGFIDLPSQGRTNANSGEAKSGRLLGNWQVSDKFNAQFLYLKDLNDSDGSPNVRPASEDTFSNDIFEHEMSKSDINLGGLTLKYDFDSVQVSSVTSVAKAKRHGVFRLGLWKDLLAQQGQQPGPTYREEPFDDYTNDDGLAQELRFVSAGEGAFTWVGGLYYQRRDQHYNQTSYIHDPPAPGDDRQLFRTGVQPLRQYSAYGEGTYGLFEAVDVTLGLRAVRETIGIHDFFQTYGALAAAQAAAGDPNPKNLNVETTYDNYLPKISIGWHATRDVMFYSLASRGYRSTTPNVQVNLGVGPPLLKADSLWNYEAGAKTTWLGGRLNMNLSVYDLNWKNLQASRQGQGHLGPAPITVIYIDNIGDAVVKGAELEVRARLLDWLTGGLTAGYQDGRLVKVDAGSVALLGSQIPNSPTKTGAMTLAFNHAAFRDLSWTADVALQYVGQQGSVEQTAADPTGSATHAYKNVRGQFGIDGQNWGVSAFGDNLLDELIELQNASLVGTEHFTTLGRPRTYGIRLTGKF